jgi:hypothetical protein
MKIWYICAALLLLPFGLLEFLSVSLLTDFFPGRAIASGLGGSRARTVRSREGRRKGLLDQHRDSSDERLRLHIPGLDLVDTKMDQVCIITPLPLIKQTIIELPLAKR